ncbi:MAG TPA: GH92 family glycosyl hydrolase [Vicinamibacterales bacterium]|nr:GH92 family glycosyl hydrolase [Vicinamibacterales bacterium]
MITLTAAAAVVMAPPAAAQTRLTSHVNPLVGTGGHGHTYPGPSLPFGMIQPGPDTRLTGWDGCSGYHYSDSRIFGFSHTHLSGTGIPDYTDVLIMPATGEVRLNNGADGTPGYSSSFSHAEEVARPGYYAVTLRDHDIRVELTTTLRVGMHRYALPKGQPAHVVLDLEHRDPLIDASLEVVSDTEVAGVRRSRSWAQDQVVYFVIRFSRPFSPARPEGASARPEGRAYKRAFGFGRDGGTLLVKVGISAVSIEGARKNLDAEVPGWDFDGVRAAADQAWERELSKIHVQGGTPGQKVNFYTALYHAMLTPNVYMDVDGRYRGRDFKVHKAEGFTYYSVFSLWDTFRALHPLLTLIDHERTRDFVQTFLRQYQEGGRLPVWELAANETDTMIGYHAVPVMADAIAKRIEGFDVDLAFAAMKHSADEDRFGLAAYKRDGFIDASQAPEGVSRTLEYAYDDWTIAQVARRLGRTDDHERYLRRAQSWKHLFDPSTGFMRARVEGFWATPFDPAEVNNHYTEANAWQYSFFVPHDLEGLMRLMGGPDALARKLDDLFSASSTTTGREQADITGLIGQYAHGNEPSHHMAYLYAYAGQPWKTQAMVRRILDTLYAPTPEGLSGNEDCGQMSAWYVFSALGFYPVAPGSTEYVIGTPLFESATITLDHGRPFTIRALGVSADAGYIQRASLNGSAYDNAFLDHATLAAGGELVFEMGTQPRTAWGSSADARPRSSVAATVVAAPFVSSGERVFRAPQQVALGVAEPDAEIRYTLDGSMPGVTSTLYDRPITISEGLTLRAIAFRTERSSPVISVTFRRLTEYPRITLSAPYAPQYAAGGDDTLIDGLRGNESFKTGRWQGYRGRDLTVTLDFGAAREIRQVAMGFIQDTGSWIFMPRRVFVEASDDGQTFEPLGTIENGTSARESKPVTRDFALDLARTRRARYLRLRVDHYGKLPAWHPGAGEDAWFFTDEIVVR